MHVSKLAYNYNNKRLKANNSGENIYHYKQIDKQSFCGGEQIKRSIFSKYLKLFSDKINRHKQEKSLNFFDSALYVAQKKFIKKDYEFSFECLSAALAKIDELYPNRASEKLQCYRRIVDFANLELPKLTDKSNAEINLKKNIYTIVFSKPNTSETGARYNGLPIYELYLPQGLRNDFATLDETKYGNFKLELLKKAIIGDNIYIQDLFCADSKKPLLPFLINKGEMDSKSKEIFPSLVLNTCRGTFLFSYRFFNKK